MNNKIFEYLIKIECYNNLIVEKFNKAKFNFIPKIKMDMNENNLNKLYK